MQEKCLTLEEIINISNSRVCLKPFYDQTGKLDEHESKVSRRKIIAEEVQNSCFSSDKVNPPEVEIWFCFCCC
jgi:hypothetical protein